MSAANSAAHSGHAGEDPVRAAVLANRGLFGVAAMFSAGISLLALTVSLYMLQVYDRVLTSRSEETLLLLTLIAMAALGFLSFLDSLRLRLLARAGMRVGEMLSARVLRAMVATSALQGGAASQQGLRDVDSLRNFLGSSGFAALFDAPFLIVFLIVLYLLHWTFFAVVLTGGAILVVIAVLTQLSTAKLVNRSHGALAQAYAFAEDGLYNADVLEGMGMSATFVGRCRRLWLDSLRMSLAASDQELKLSSISRAVRQLIQVALLGLGALLVLDFQATGGVMIAASIIGSRALAPIEAIVGNWRGTIAVLAAWKRLVQLLELAPKRDEGMALPAPRGDLQVQRATYASRATRKVILTNINFELRAGESLGIIGPSAAGKSTLVRLLVGAWPCVSGVVRLDAADIYAWPRADLSRYIGYLPQDVELFSGTVRENIARLSEGDPEAIVRAAKLANADEMIRSLPKGYDTDIGAHGSQLSGGQRQRIALARALYGDPRLVALDEPNSNLDAAGEEALLATLAELKRRDVTVIVVAHRPSILERMDKMLALRDGAVEAFGPRAEVMQRYTTRAPMRAGQPNIVTLPMVHAQPGGE